MLPQVKGIFNNEIHLSILAFAKQRKFMRFPIVSKCRFSCKNMACYLGKIVTKIAKIYAKIGKFYVKNPPKICTNFTPKAGQKWHCFLPFLRAKSGAKLHEFPSIFCSKFIPKQQLFRRIFPPWLATFLLQKTRLFVGISLGNYTCNWSVFCIKSCVIFAIFSQEFSLAKRPKMLANNYFGHNAMSKIIMKKFCNIYFLNSQKLSR